MSFSFCQDFITKSVAPVLMACTAISTSPKAITQDDNSRRIQLQNLIQPVKPLLSTAYIAREIHVEKDNVVLLVLKQSRVLLRPLFSIHEARIFLQQQPYCL